MKIVINANAIFPGLYEWMYSDDIEERGILDTDIEDSVGDYFAWNKWGETFVPGLEKVLHKYDSSIKLDGVFDAEAYIKGDQFILILTGMEFTTTDTFDEADQYRIKQDIYTYFDLNNSVRYTETLDADYDYDVDMFHPFDGHYQDTRHAEEDEVDFDFTIDWTNINIDITEN